MFSDNIKLGIYSEKNVLSAKLESKFKDKDLEVVTFQNFSEINIPSLNYLIVDLIDKRIKIDEIKKYLVGTNSKIIVLLPSMIRKSEKNLLDAYIKNLLELNINLGIILVPELLAEGVKYRADYISHDLIMQSIVSERVKLKTSEMLSNTISLGQLTEKIVKETLSFGITGQAMALTGPKKSWKKILIKYLETSENNIIFTKGESDFDEVFKTISSRVNFSVRMAVKATKKTFLNNLKEAKNKVTAPKNDQPVKRYNFKTIVKLTSIFVLVFLTPFFTLLLSAFLLYFSTIYAKDISVSKNLIKYSKKVGILTQNISFGIPFYYNYSNIILKTNTLLSEVIEITRIGNEFVLKILGNASYDTTSFPDNFTGTLDKIHTDISFLQSDLNELNDLGGRRLKSYLLKSKIDIDNYKNKVYLLRNFSSRLSTILGFDKPQKYLVLFQNNMELRPTGGFIGSFALISFDKGKLTEIVVSDVYSADGQLKGHVDPPEALRTHLGEGGWFMRDANWDPDFIESAKKIEWFLEKEINTEVNGVMAIDLSFVQNLLKVTGPINLIDYGKVITSENLYLNTQNEVQTDFFPGSIKKVSFLTSLSKALMFETQSIKSNKYFALFKEIYKSLEERHIQIYLHDNNAQESLSKLNYSGEVDTTVECGQRCINDNYSLIDANLGVNKANYFIKRDQELKILVTKEKIEHELFVTYVNTATPVLGSAGIYKSYSRLLVPLESEVKGVRAYNIDGSYEDLAYDLTDINNRKELGFLVNILPSNTKKIQIAWNLNSSNLSNGGEYKLLVRKQAGIDNDYLKVNIGKTELFLTGRAPSVYTTTLTKDFNIKLFFRYD